MDAARKLIGQLEFSNEHKADLTLRITAVIRKVSKDTAQDAEVAAPAKPAEEKTEPAKEAAPPPPAEKPATWTTTQRTSIHNRVISAFPDNHPTDILKGLDVTDFPGLGTPEQAWEHIRTHAIQNTFTVIAEKVKYIETGKKHLLFTTPVGDICAYGRSTTFKEMVGDTYYTEAGFEAMKGSEEKQHEIDPVKLEWTHKGHYMQVTGATPIMMDDDDTDSDNDDLPAGGLDP